MPRRLISTDLDGTIVFNGTISLRDREAISGSVKRIGTPMISRPSSSRRVAGRNRVSRSDPEPIVS